VMQPMDMLPLLELNRIEGGLEVEVPGAQTVNVFGETVDAEPEEAEEDAEPTIYDPIAVHPAEPHELEQLPDALRTKATLTIYATQPLFDPTTGRACVVLYGGRRWEAVWQRDYSVQCGVYEALAQYQEGA
jgi:hypothetical protein